jgi:hypothetical protein
MINFRKSPLYCIDLRNWDQRCGGRSTSGMWLLIEAFHLGNYDMIVGPRSFSRDMRERCWPPVIITHAPSYPESREQQEFSHIRQYKTTS